ncbi:hypothetical protein RND81_14G185900 [Saponaria officinalis]|uniref:F-box associated domain-containing protein n=1 Tax=Saponaria officinalis TaxID=3572 RepID=A0AAW1GNI4_SAPOF
MFMYIFNLSEKTWRYHDECVGVNFWDIKSFDGVFFREACHWICSFHSFDHNVAYQIFAFDMSTESSITISFPDVGDGCVWFNTSITTLNGCLALVDGLGGEDVEMRFLFFLVWVMADYGVTESWSMRYRVSPPDGIVGQFLGIAGDRFYDSEGEGWLVSYDVDSKDVERYGILDESIYNLLPYEESLVRIVSL